MIYNYKLPLMVKVILYSVGFFLSLAVKTNKKKDIKKFNNKLIFFFLFISI